MSLLGGRDIRHGSSTGLGALPSEQSSANLSAKENLPAHTQLSVALQSVAGNNVSSYRSDRYLFLCLH